MSLLVLITASIVLGSLFLKPLRLDGGADSAAYRLLSGLCLSGLLIMALGSYSLAWAQAALLAIAGIGVAYELFVLARRRKPPVGRKPTGFSAGVLDYVCLAAIVGPLCLALVSALAPITSWDAGVAHLSLPQAYTRVGRIMAFEGNAYSVYPQLMHSLYTYAFSENGENVAALVNWLFAALACYMVYFLGRQIESRRCGLIGAAILATAPIFMDQAGTVSLDLAFTCVATAALAALVTYYHEGKLAWLILAAFMAGSSCGIRHTGYLVCVLLGCATLFGKTEARLKAVAWFTGVSLLAAAPWLLRTYLLTGNPVFPFLMAWFPPSGIADAPISIGTHESVKAMGWRQAVMFPWDIIMRPYFFDGWRKSPGGLVLILGVPGLVAGGRRARWLGAYSATGCGCFFVFQRLARYMLPFFVPMMVVSAVAACRLTALRALTSVALVATFVYGLALDVGLVEFKFPVVLGQETRDQYLTQRVERYPAFEWVNKNIPPTSTVLTLDVRSYYIKGSSYQNYEALKSLIGKSRDKQIAWLKSRGIRYLLYPDAYLTESPGYGQSGLLTMFESWRRDPLHFRLLKSFDLPRPRRGGREHVEIYEINYGGA